MNLRLLLFNFRLWLYRHKPIRPARIVFLSHLGKKYGCNPRYICEYLAENHPAEFELIWVYDASNGAQPPQLPIGVKAMPFFSHQCLSVMATAGVIISNTRISQAFHFKKRRGQQYIQTWHSSLRLKCIEADADLGDTYECFAKSDSAQTDVIFSGCKFSTNIFKKSFWYDGPVIESGTARIDWLRHLKPKKLEHIYVKSGLNPAINYVLYAPTFRKNGDTAPYINDFTPIVASLEKRFGGKWNVLYRLHPNLMGQVMPLKSAGAVIDATQYDDIQELLAISAMLITDYSSSMFDAAFCKKICMLYANDLDDYIVTERKLYFDINSLPFPVAPTPEQLCRLIENYNPVDYGHAITSFMQNIGSCEHGSACETIAKYIIERINERPH